MNEILERLKRQWVRILLSFVVVVIFLMHVVGIMPMRFIDQMENIAYDARLVLSMPRTMDDNIVIVDLDEKSLAAQGRWPWSRDIMATLIDQMFDHYKVGIVGFDIVFAEPDKSSGLGTLERLAEDTFKDVPAYQERLQELRGQLNYDELFAKSLEGRPVVMGYYFNDEGQEDRVTNSGLLPEPSFIKGSFKGKRISFLKAAGYGANLELFQNKAMTGGHFNPSVDTDGVVRRVPILYEYDGQQYESLSIAMTRLVLGAKRIEPRYAEVPWGSKNYSGLEWFGLGNRIIPVDEAMRALVPYRGTQGSFPYVSATDVITGKADANIMKGAIILIGTTAPGLLDLRATPVQRAYPGVEVHANLISGILNQTLMEKPAYTLGAEFLILLLVGLIMSIGLPLLSPLWATVVTFGLLLMSVGINLLVWNQANLVLPVASGVMLILVSFLVNMSYGYFVETRGKRQLAGLFGQYIPPELVGEMSDNPDAYSMEAESRDMSVLFSDVRGFTTISEGLNPKELSELMNAVLTPMTHVIHERRGTIDKYMGDAIMAFWGAPLKDENHARHAVKAGMQMLQRLKELEGEFKSRGWPDIRVGVGVNTGNMSVGNMGSEFRMAYTVLGDAVNLGSRLEGLTKGYGVEMIVSEITMERVPEIVFRELDRVRVKGKDEPVTIFEPVMEKQSIDKATRDEIKLYQQALKYYRNQDWDMAELQFLNLQKMSPKRRLYKVYQERVGYYRANPPGADWDGVFTHTSK